MKKTFLIFVLLISLLPLRVFTQSFAGESADFEYRYLIDMPTAGVLKKGYVSFISDLMPKGAVVSRLEVGVFDGLSFGISYGGENVIGSGEVNWYKYPGVNIRYKIIEESQTLPSVALGFDSQGKGEFFNNADRFEIKSPGFFGAVSKNYEFLGYLSLHGAVNYSLETKDGDNFVNLAVGLEKTIGRQVSFVAEYNFALNDNKNDLYGRGNGYMHVGVRWNIGKGLMFGLDLRDMLDNKRWNPSKADRALKFEFSQRIL